MARGKLILIEGLDRTGKSTQAAKLVESLSNQARLVKFPERSTPIGKLINQYLKESETHLADQAIHLLFSANRWEVAETIKATLLEGRDVVMDRYVYSGIAYSAAKAVPGMDVQWCAQPEKGLLKPDLTFFLTNSESELRKGFGDERYESSGFQTKVRHEFETIFKNYESQDYKNNHIVFLDTTGKSIEQVHTSVGSAVEEYIQKNSDVEEFMYF
ncbi:LAME_0D04544g1_1 [Lachancea meyersii CBS 8951]|uniref:Thymidylate kinase n=1 Tax=Lachancea meyersii CBS 8951 TaxID=1266667 RepID=A0A1G4J8U9_9SACH|nr:LAME_0D04544g1_1 [Lachancea meyersii CBS 8951]